MEHLPLEIYEAIFEHLNMVDIARLRPVCKKLRSVVKEYPIRELYLSAVFFTKSKRYQNGFIFRPRNLRNIVPIHIRNRSGTSDPLPEGCFLRPPEKPTSYTFLVAAIFLKSGLFNLNLLRCLSCRLSPLDGVLLADLNKLSRLERLEIFCFGYDHFHLNLCLPNLRVLIAFIDTKMIEIDIPRCEGFHFKGSSKFKFSHPDSVRYLSLEKLNEDAYVFKNVEDLQVFSLESSLDESFYSAFPRLKTLRILNCRSLETLRQTVLFNRLRHGDLKIFLCGIPLLTGKELEDHEDDKFAHFYINFHKDRQRFPILIQHYDRLEEGLNFATYIEHSERAAELFERDPQKFVRIFDNILVVNSQIAIDKPEQFFELLSRCNELEALSIAHSGLDQEWFDRLASLKTLERLCIREEGKINLTFVRKLPKLYRIGTNHDLDLIEEVPLNELDRTQSYISITLKIGELYVNLCKINDHCNDHYYFTKGNDFRVQPNYKIREKNLQEVFRRIDRIRNGEEQLDTNQSNSRCSIF